MDLTLDKETATDELFHSATGSKFTIAPMTIARYNALIKKNTKSDVLDGIALKKDVAVEVIMSWSDNIKAECDEANKAKFGAKFAAVIMPEIVEKALALGTGVSEEVGAAKNV